VGLLSLVVLCALTVSGCGSSKSTSDQGSPEKTRTTVVVDPSRQAPKDLARVPVVAHPKGAGWDATFGACAATSGIQTVAGRLKSSARSRTDYVVVVSWINKTYDVRGRGVQVLRRVAPGARKPIKVEANVAPGASRCTFNVTRGTVK
jgi:hypothetical protein